MMQVEIKIDTSCAETKVTIIVGKMTDEVSELARKISEFTPNVLVGFRGEDISVLEYEKVIRFYSANQKVYAVTENGEYTIRLRLYELEGRLNIADFVRISNSEIINIKAVKGFDLSFSGTICVKFRDDSVTYASRRYVSQIKRVFGL
jgi:DNA-binding LytR/AlgR family response regulator